MKIQQITVIVMILIFGSFVTYAQMTAFNYQGRLTDGGTPANGNYQMQFKLFDALAGGTQIGVTVSDVPVTATNGVFSVKLDFGANALSGANRWLEIAVRRSAGENYTTLSPREQIASSPYAVRTLSAQQADLALDSQKLGGLLASEYVTNATLSTNFIRNQTTQQANANFNIGGNGAVGGSLVVNGASPLGGLFLTGGTVMFRAQNSGNFFSLGTTTNSPMSFFTNNGTNNGSLTLDTSGNIGINTIFPNHKLTIDTLGGPTWTNQSWGGAIALRNSSAIGWQLNSSNLSFGIGQSTDGLSFFRTTNSPGTSGNTPVYDLQITNQGNVGIGTSAPNAKLFVQGEATNGVGIAATGNASQSRNKGGWVKAMMYINPNGTIARCYNALTGSSTGNCGFTSTRVQAGTYDINFGFQIDDRFISLTAAQGSGIGECVINGFANLIVANGNSATVITSCPDGARDKPFFVFIF